MISWLSVLLLTGHTQTSSSVNLRVSDTKYRRKLHMKLQYYRIGTKIAVVSDVVQATNGDYKQYAALFWSNSNQIDQLTVLLATEQSRF